MRVILMIFVLLLATDGFAETGNLVIQRGHSDEILFVSVDPAGKTYATASRDKTVKVWDIRSGKLITTVTGFSFYVTKVGYSPEGGFIYMRGDLGTCKVISTKDYTDVTSKFYDDFFPITQMTFGVNDEMLLFGIKGSAFVVNTRSWNKYLVSGRVAGEVDHLFFNKAEKKVEVRSKGGQMIPIDISGILEKENFNIDRKPSGHYPYKAEIKDDVVIISDASGDVYAQRSQPRPRIPVMACFSPDNSKIAIGFEDMNDVIIWSLQTNAITRIDCPAENNRALLFSNDGNMLFIGSGNKLMVIGLEGSGRQNIFSVNGAISSLDLSADNKFLVTGTKDGELIVYDLVKKAIASQFSTGKGITAVSIHPKGKMVAVTLNGQVALYKFPQLKEDKIIVKGKGSRDAAFSGDGKFLIAQDAKTKKVMLYETGKEEPAKSFKDPSEHITRSEAAIQKQLFPVSFSNKLGYFVSMGEEWVVHLRNVSGNVTRELKGHSSWANSFFFSTDDQFLLSTSDDASIRLWNLETMKETGIMVFDERDFVIALNDNHYFTSKGGYDLVGFFLKGEIHPFEQFDLHFNRPDLILKAFGSSAAELQNAYMHAWEKRIMKAGLTNAITQSELNPPLITILNKNKIPPRISVDEIKLSVEAKVSGGILDRLLIWINDVPVLGKNGWSVKDEQSRELKKEIPVKLAEGINKVEVAVMSSNGIESFRDRVFVEYVPELKGHKKLFFAGIGSGEFVQAQYDLKYPGKDVSDLADHLSGLKGILFDDVQTKIFTDKNVTKSILPEIKKFFQLAGRNDIVILFFAGHGVLDADFNYYLSVADMDFTNPGKNGFIYSDLENTLDQITSLKKLFLIDACHSGETDKDEMVFVQDANTEKSADIAFRNAGAKVEMKNNLGLKTSSELIKELFADVRRGTGATVISSAGGAEFAMESAQWKNGLFTYCLLNGLKNKDADIDEDGAISVSEVLRYVSENVSQLSGGRQNPTTRLENISIDFILN